MQKKNKIIDDIRSGFTQAVANHVFQLLIPVVLASAVILANAFQQSLPWAYVIAAASLTMTLGFGGVATGLNQLAAFRSRIQENDSLKLHALRFEAINTIEDDSRPKKAVRACITLINRADYPISSKVKGIKFYLEKNDGTARRESSNKFDLGVKAFPSKSLSTFVSPFVFVEDLKDEKTLKGRFELQIEFGRKHLKHIFDKRTEVYGAKEEDGSWSFVSAEINP